MSGGGGDQTVGYRYGLGFHIAACHGPIDALKKITIDDREAWSGNVTSSSTQTINKPDLFGGDEREGGIVGSFDVMMGEPTQGMNPYLVSVIEGTGGVIPAFRGLFSLVWKGGLITSNNPYIKPWALLLTRILQGWGAGGAWYSSKASIDFGGGIVGMNAAHVLYQCLTNAEWGMGYPTTSINDANFRAAADTLFDEGFGLCMIWNQQTDIQDFVQLVCDHIGANLNANPSTGQFEIKLIRDDYDASTLPLYGVSEIEEVQGFQRAAWGETVNEITVKFNDQALGKGSSVTVQDLANIRAQGAVVPESRTYAGLPTQALAARVAQRDLRARSTPLAAMTIIGNRKLAGIMPGDVFRVTWPKDGLSGVVFRALKVSTGTLTNGQVSIQCVEDVFGMPASSYIGVQPVGWVDPSRPPAPAPDEIAFEAPLYELQRALGSTAALALPADAGYAVAAASKPSSVSFDFGMYVERSPGTYAEATRGSFAPSARLVSAITAGQTSVAFNTPNSISDVRVGMYALISGTEIVRIDAIDVGTGMLTIGRGLLDTPAKKHAAGASIIFCDGFLAYDEQQRVGGETARVKVTPRTGQGELALSAAATLSFVLNDRAFRPYAPGRLRLNTVAFPDVVQDSLAVSWAHRNRLQQNLEGDETGNIGPEPGTTYSARVVRLSDSADVQVTAGVSSTVWAPSGLATGEYRVEVWSVRDGVESFQRNTHEFVFLATTIFGWNRAWGFKWNGVPVVEINLRSAFDVTRINASAVGTSQILFRQILPSGDYIDVVHYLTTSSSYVQAQKWDTTGRIRRGQVVLAANFRAGAYDSSSGSLALAVDNGTFSPTPFVVLFDAEASLKDANSTALVRPGGGAAFEIRPVFSVSPSGIEIMRVAAGGGSIFVSNTTGTDLLKYNATTGALQTSRTAAAGYFGDSGRPINSDGTRVALTYWSTTPSLSAGVRFLKCSDLSDDGGFTLPGTFTAAEQFPNEANLFGGEVVTIEGPGASKRVYRYSLAGASLGDYGLTYASNSGARAARFGRYLSISRITPMNVFDTVAGYTSVPDKSYVP